MKLNENLSFSRYEWAASVLGPLLADSPSKLVLDIGASDGRMRPQVEAAAGIYRGFDLNPVGPGVERWDLDDPAPDSVSPGGAALLLDVIEHCNNPGIALRHISEALESAAFLVLTMPNPRWSRSRLSAVLHGTPTCFTQADLDGNHHVFTPWPHILERFLNDAGFHIKQYVTLDGTTPWPGPPFKLRYPVRVAVAAAMKFIEWRDPSACGLSYGVVARKK